MATYNGGAGNDEYTGTNGPDMINGHGGDDILDGAGGDDTVGGGGGDDVIYGGGGTNMLSGDAGADVIWSFGSRDDIGGGAGNDVIRIGGLVGGAVRGGGEIDTLILDNAVFDGAVGAVDWAEIEYVRGSLVGTEGADVLDLSAFKAKTRGADLLTIDGGAGDDHIIGSAYARTDIYGGAGNDLIEDRKVPFGGSFSVLYGDAGDDRIIAVNATETFGGAGNDVMTMSGAGEQRGGSGDDHITGGFGTNLILGGTGSDQLYGDHGNDELDGGTGIDRLYGGDGSDTLSVLEDADTLNDDRDELYGGEGSDRLAAGFGDVIDGGDHEAIETDFLILDLVAAPSGQTIDFTDLLNGGTLTLGGGTISGIEAITLVRGSEFADDLRVGPDASGLRELAGGGGDDRLAAGASGTTLRGEDGDDLLIGSRGGDFIYGGQGNDTASYANADDSVVVRLAADGENSFGGGGNDVFNSIENVIGSNFDDVIEGDELDNRLTGGQGVDHLFGGGGDDHLIGGDQADRMEGGLGDDFYSVLSGGDLVIEEPGAGYDTVFAAVNHSLAEGVEQLRLGGSAGRGDGNRLNNLIIGNDNGELLYGHVGKDELRGGNGDDRLNGGRGIDLLIGGAGADQFRFEEGDTRDSRATADVVEDLSRADRDRINLRAIDADESTPGANENFSFIGTSAFSGQAGELRYETVDGHRYAYGDTDGDAAADLVIRVDGLEPLRASDFVL